MMKNIAVKIGMLGIVIPLFLSCNKSNRPNIIIIMADDLGYGDLGCYGSSTISTPNIDSLAASGVVFTQHYAASAVSTPSRAAMLTGRYPLRFDIHKHFSDGNSTFLPTNQITSLGELLQGEGYFTAHIGKWHLGGLKKEQVEARKNNQQAIPGPLEHGFDHYLCMNEETNPRQQLHNGRELYKKGGKYLLRNDMPVDSIDKHLTEIQTEEALQVIDQYSGKSKPFFINLWYDAPHTPYEPAPEPFLSMYKNDTIEPDNIEYNSENIIGDGILYNSMVSHMDNCIGKIIQKLKETNQLENTLIIFTSDNGPSYRGSAGPFTSGKADLHEGGIRVPLIVFWKNHFTHRISDEICNSVDIFPTIAAICGASIDSKEKIDGVTMYEHLKGEKLNRYQTMFWYMDLYKWYPQPGIKPLPYSTSVVRLGDWKLHCDSITPVALYNITEDPHESNNLVIQKPEIRLQLLTDLKNFLSEPRNQEGMEK